MRQLTAYASYLDNLGAPLVGRARFYNLDDSPAVVYGLDNAHQHYVELGHIVYTNSSGQLVPQVFLDDHDYLVVFDKYIGGGTMAEDDDQESWQEMGSAVDNYNTVGISLEGNALRTVSTISELRHLHPVVSDDHDETVTLLGYYEIDDKPSINYHWNQYSNDDDNGGSVIKVADIAIGRWELVECPRYLDVRHFGGFGLNNPEASPNQRYFIQLAAAYALSNNCGLYFHGTPTNAYYDITGLELHDVDSSAMAMVFAVLDDGDSATDVKARIYGVKNILCSSISSQLSNQGAIELIDDVLKTSYAPEYNAILNPKVLIIDSPFNSQNKTFENIIVKCLRDISSESGWTFNNCIVLYSNARNDIECGNINTTDDVAVGGDASIDGKLTLGAYKVSHSSSILNGLLLKMGSTNVMSFTNAIAKFFESLDIPNGWVVDDDNLLTILANETVKTLKLKVDAVIDLVAKNGQNDDIKFDRMSVTNRADIRRVNVNTVYPMTGFDISVNGGMYRSYGASLDLSWTSYGSHSLPADTTAHHIRITTKNNGGYDTPLDYMYIDANNQSTLYQTGQVICIENCGGGFPGTTFSDLTSRGDMYDFLDDARTIFILRNANDELVDVVPMFSRKYFRYDGSKFVAVSI